MVQCYRLSQLQTDYRAVNGTVLHTNPDTNRLPYCQWYNVTDCPDYKQVTALSMVQCYTLTQLQTGYRAINGTVLQTVPDTNRLPRY